jgi:hypothetical protein
VENEYSKYSGIGRNNCGSFGPESDPCRELKLKSGPSAKIFHNGIITTWTTSTGQSRMQGTQYSALSGGCLCGKCTFEVPATSVRFGFASCHCSACRLSHAAPFVQWSGLNAANSADFVINGASELLTAFRSSATCTRYFCTTCGSHVYIQYDHADSAQWAGEIHFPTALLNAGSILALEEVRAGLLYATNAMFYRGFGIRRPWSPLGSLGTYTYLRRTAHDVWEI